MTPFLSSVVRFAASSAKWPNWRVALLAALWLGGSAQGWAQSPPTSAPLAAPAWTVVQPVKATHYKTDVARVFAQQLTRELGKPVTVHEATRDLGAPALAWSLTQAPQRRSIVLMTEEMSLVGDAARGSAQHLSHYAPLLVLLETRWCLFVPTHSPLLKAESLLDWAKRSVQTPRVAIPVASGRMRLWVQGMAMRTNRAWEMDTYGIAGDVGQALQHGSDVALGRCDQQWRNATNTRILAKGSDSKDGFLPQTPLFTDLGWMPLGNGWLAWLAPKSIPQAERDAMAQMLYKIAIKPEVRMQLEATEQIVIPMSPQASAGYLMSFIHTWTELGQLLLGRDFGDLSKMQGLAVPRKPGPEG